MSTDRATRPPRVAEWLLQRLLDARPAMPSSATCTRGITPCDNRVAAWRRGGGIGPMVPLR